MFIFKIINMDKIETSKFKIGRHISLKNTFLASIQYQYETYKVYEGHTNAFQMFMKSPQKFSLSKLTDDDAINTKKYVEDNNIYLVSHSAFICNIGKPIDVNSYQIKMIKDDLSTIERIGGVGTVIHVGKYCKLPGKETECINNMVEFTKKIIEETPDLKSFFILETAAGQGTECCVTIEKLAEYHKLIPDKYKHRLRYCIDTCHIYSAGYDISTELGVMNYINKFDNMIGWEYVELIHFNNSKKECGCKIDRHANINDGCINIKGLKTFAILAAHSNKAIINETPCGGKEAFDEIELVYKWINDYGSKDKSELESESKLKDELKDETE